MNVVTESHRFHVQCRTAVLVVVAVGLWSCAWRCICGAETGGFDHRGLAASVFPPSRPSAAPPLSTTARKSAGGAAGDSRTDHRDHRELTSIGASKNSAPAFPTDATSSVDEWKQTRPKKSTDGTPFVIREGTELNDRLAVFKPAGDRTLCFVAGVPQRLIVVENLTLERVLQTIERSSVELQWSIRGVVTEFRGGNYLLLQRAVVLGPAGTTVQP